MLTSQRAATTARCGPPHNPSALPLGRSEAQEAPETNVWLPPPAMHCCPALSRQSQRQEQMQSRLHHSRKLSRDMYAPRPFAIMTAQELCKTTSQESSSSSEDSRAARHTTDLGCPPSRTYSTRRFVPPTSIA